MDNIIIFVHGLGSSADKAWACFKKLIAADNDFDEKFTVHCYQYPTRYVRLPFCRKLPSLQTLAQGLATEIETRYDMSENITLVCHSMGGIIGRQYILGQIKTKKRLRVKRLLLYATPNNGNDLAGVLNIISFGNNVLKQLCKKSDFIQQLNEDWEIHRVEEKINVKYVLAGQDSVVDETSARHNWRDFFYVVPGKDHGEVIRPVDHNDLSYVLFKQFVMTNPNNEATKKVGGVYADYSVDRIIQSAVGWLLSAKINWGPKYFSEEPRIANVVEGIFGVVYSNPTGYKGATKDIITRATRYLLDSIDENGLKSLSIKLATTHCTAMGLYALQLIGKYGLYAYNDMDNKKIKALENALIISASDYGWGFINEAIHTRSEARFFSTLWALRALASTEYAQNKQYGTMITNLVSSATSSLIGFTYGDAPKVSMVSLLMLYVQDAEHSMVRQHLTDSVDTAKLSKFILDTIYRGRYVEVEEYVSNYHGVEKMSWVHISCGLAIQALSQNYAQLNNEQRNQLSKIVDKVTRENRDARGFFYDSSITFDYNNPHIFPTVYYCMGLSCYRDSLIVLRKNNKGKEVQL